MEQQNIQVLFDEEKLEALRYFLSEKGASLETELEKSLAEMYEKNVPPQVRSYIEKRPIPRKTKGKKKGENKPISED